MKEQILRWWYRRRWFLLIILIILALEKGFLIQSSVANMNASDIIVLNDKWEKEWTEDHKILEYHYQIPSDVEDSLKLSVKTYVSEFSIYLDNEIICNYSNKFGTNGGGQYMVQLPADAAGKMLIFRVEKQDKGNANLIDNAYLGSNDAILFKLLCENLYALFFGVFTLIVGMVILFVEYYMGKKLTGGTNRSMLCLSIFIFLAGVWVVTDSNLLLFVINKTAVISLVSFTSFMLMPIYLLEFVAEIFEKKKSLIFLQRFFFTMAILYLLNYLFPVIYGSWLLLPVHVGCAAGMGIVLNMGYKRLKKRKDREVQEVFQGFVLLSVFIAAAFVVYYINSVSGYSILYCIGICLFILNLLYVAIARLCEQIEQDVSVTAYKKLAYMDTMTGLLNRTAFIREQVSKPLSAGSGYIILDINGLKQINDCYGHLEGDHLIIDMAKHVKGFFGEGGTCFRMGGDEFLVILEDTTEKDIAAAVDRMQKQFEEENKARKIPLNIAAGYAVWQVEGDTPNQLFRRADANMYENKQKMKIQDFNESTRG